MTCLVILGWQSNVYAQLKILESGPQPGSDLVKVMVTQVDGTEADLLDGVADRAGAILVVHEVTRNTAPIIRYVDTLAGVYSGSGFAGRVLFLHGDRTEGMDLLRRVNGSLKPIFPFTLSNDGIEGPGEFALNKNCALTLILFNKGKITKSVGMTDVGYQDLNQIENWVTETLGFQSSNPARFKQAAINHAHELEANQGVIQIVQTQADVIARLFERLKRMEQRQMQNPRATRQMRSRPTENNETANRPRAEGNAEEAETQAKRRGKPPEDPELNRLLRSFIRKTNTDEEVDRLFHSIESLSKESIELQIESVDMFELMLSFPDRYGSSYAQKKAREFLNSTAKE